MATRTDTKQALIHLVSYHSGEQKFKSSFPDSSQRHGKAGFSWRPQGQGPSLGFLNRQQCPVLLIPRPPFPLSSKCSALICLLLTLALPLCALDACRCLGDPKNQPCQGQGEDSVMPDTQKALSLLSRTHVEKLGLVTHAWNPTAGELETGRFLGLPGQPA